MVRVCCWNVNSLAPTVRNINLKYGSLHAFFDTTLDADIVCMQEVKLPDSKLSKELVVVEGYQSYWACSQSKTGYSGVTTWARHSWAATSAQADSLSVEGCEKEGRAVVTDHGSFVLFNVYVPNAGDRPERVRLAAKLSFLTALREQVDSLLGQGRQVVLVGDFNVAAERRDVHDACNWDSLYDPAELTALHAITGPTGSNCTDTWRHLHPDTNDVYTVWNERTSARAFNVGLRIDYALVSTGLLNRVVSSEVLLDMPPKWSDHAPLMLHMDLTAPFAASAQAAAAAGGGSPQQAQQPAEQLPPAPECPMWQQLLRRFHDPSQRSIASMFKAAATKPKPAAQQAAPPPPAAPAPPAAAAAAQASLPAASSQPAAPPAASQPDPVGSQGRVDDSREHLQPQQQDDTQSHHSQQQQDQQAQSQPTQQKQQQQQQPKAQGRKPSSGSSSKGASRQAPAASKRKAGSKADASAAKDPKQARLDSFFGSAKS